jgi:glycosyltransferase involved in cell wall biosynthesis
MIGRMRYPLPLTPTLARKFDALAEELDVRVLASSAGDGGSDDRFVLFEPRRPRRLDGALFYALLPVRVARELRSFRPDAVLAQGAHEAALALVGRRLARVPTAIVADLHGDWRAPARLYGSPGRRLLAPLADLVARVGLRRADGVRTIGEYTSRLAREAGREPTSVFPAYMDLEPFLSKPATPLPVRPTALFVGVLERYKAVDVLARAWPLVERRLPGARLHVVGRGTMTSTVEALVSAHPASVRWTPSLPVAEVAAALDQATLLVLPSRSEGMGRVVVEAFCRARPVVASRVGGIPDLVADGVNGLLVPPGEPEALAEAVAGLLADRELAARLGEAGRGTVEPWLATPAEFAQRTRALVERVRG